MDAYEKDRETQIKRLMDAVKQCQIEFGGKTNLASEDDSCICCLVSQFEKSLQHGLRKSKMLEKINSISVPLRHLTGKIIPEIDENTFWNVVKVHLGGTDIQHIESNAQSESGKARIWLRTALNEHTLERQLHTVLADRDLLLQHYEPWSLMLDVERSSTMPPMARGLASIVFAIDTKNTDLNLPLKTVDPPVDLTAKETKTHRRIKSSPLPTIYNHNPELPVMKKSAMKKKKKRKVLNATISNLDDEILSSSYTKTLPSSLNSEEINFVNNTQNASLTNENSLGTGCTSSIVENDQLIARTTSISQIVENDRSSDNLQVNNSQDSLTDLEHLDIKRVHSAPVSPFFGKSSIPDSSVEKFPHEIETESGDSNNIYKSDKRESPPPAENVRSWMNTETDENERNGSINDSLSASPPSDHDDDQIDVLLMEKHANTESEMFVKSPSLENISDEQQNEFTTDDALTTSGLTTTDMTTTRDDLTTTDMTTTRDDLTTTDLTTTRDDLTTTDLTTTRNDLTTTDLTTTRNDLTTYDSESSRAVSNTMALLSNHNSQQIFHSNNSSEKNEEVTACKYTEQALPGSLTTNDLKQAILMTAKKKEDLEEKNKALRTALDLERSANQQLKLAYESVEKELQQKKDTQAKQVLNLTRENEVLKTQLKKYVAAVQMLRKGETLTQETNEAIGNLRSTNDDVVVPTPPPKHSEIESNGIYEEKLSQMAEMHGELIELQEHLQRQLMSRDHTIARMHQQLVNLRGPLPSGELGDQSSTTSQSTESLEHRLISIWVPSVFLKGKGSDAYHLYQVYMKIGEDEWNVYRRYSQFNKLHAKMCKSNPELEAFQFPKKKVFGKKDIKFVEERRKRLQRFLRTLINTCLANHLSIDSCKEDLLKHIPFFGEDFCEDGSKEKERPKSPQYTGL